MCFQVPEGAVEGAGRRASSSQPPPVCLPPGQPLLWTLFPGTGGHTKEEDQRTEPEGAGAGDVGSTDGAGSSQQVGPTQRRWRKRDRQRRTDSGRRKEEGGRRTREKEDGRASRLTGTWHTSCYRLQWAPPGRLIAGACLSVCVSAASCEAHRLGWGVWLGLRVHRPEMLLSASRRTQPLEILECVVVGCGAGGAGSGAALTRQQRAGSWGQEPGGPGKPGPRVLLSRRRGQGRKGGWTRGLRLNPGTTQSQTPWEALGDHSRDAQTLPHPCPLPWPPPRAGVSCELWAGWRRSLMLLARYLGR